MSTKKHRTLIPTVLIAAIALLAAAAQAQTPISFEFVNVGDTTTPIPGGAGNFNLVELPAISDGLVAFRGTGGVYTRSILSDPTISVIADVNMLVPGGAGGTFQFISPPSLHFGDIAFAGTGTNGEKGIYARINGALNVVADLNTVVPTTASTFETFFDPWVYDGAVVFEGHSIDGSEGIYTTQGGSLRTVVDTNTAIPGGVGNFTSFLGGPSFDNYKTVFYGLGSNGQRGLYLEQPGSGISLIADLNTPSPIGGNFTELGSSISTFNTPKIEDGVVYFTGHDGNGDVGLYRRDQNGISAIVDAGNTMLADFPGEIFNSIRGFGVSDGAVAFLGSGVFSSPTHITDGVYTTLGGSLIKVLNNDDTLNGLDHGSLGFYGQGIDGNMIAFNALALGPNQIRANFVGISLDGLVEATTLFVNAAATGANDGTSWPDAFVSLQDALADASANGNAEQIWVAAGTYRPDQGAAQTAGDRFAKFQLLNGVTLYGGFAGGESLLTESDPQANVTVLSGDLNGDDSPGFLNYAENSYSMVSASGTDASAAIDGFTIQGGTITGMGISGADPTVTHCIFTANQGNLGAGMYVFESSPTVTDCTFSGNVGTGSFSRGAGMYIKSGNATVTSCLFTANSVTSDGAGMYITGGSVATVTDCTFSVNIAQRDGGGMWNFDSDSVVTNCTFSGNAARNGAGMVNQTSSPTITNCSFSENSVSDNGGGIYSYDSSSPVVNNSTFSRNNAGENGGGIYNDDTSSAAVINSIFRQNSALDCGGAMWNFSSDTTLVNCIFNANSADSHGGGIFSDYGAPTVTNCTFSSNAAVDLGGGMFNSNSSSPTLTNCILWGNTAGSGNQILNSGGVPAIGFCDIQGSGGSGAWDNSLGIDSGGNIDADPLFADADGTDNLVGTPDDDLRLAAGLSPCIDAGDNTAVPPAVTADLDSNLRFVDHGAVKDTGSGTTPIVDMGALEALGDCDANGTPDELDPDTDGDGLIDDCDRCPGFDDAIDTNDDGIPDGCDGAFQLAKLTAADAVAHDTFGRTVAVSGDTVVVGAFPFGDDHDTTRVGGAYVFVGSGRNWTQQAKLVGSDAVGADGFGASVSISGDTLVVGAPQPFSGPGAVYVFVRTGETWTEQTKLTASDGALEDRFGQSVSIDGNTLVVGAEHNFDVRFGSGAAYVFVRTGETWTQRAKLSGSSPSQANARRGTSVSISGDTVLVGALADAEQGFQAGAVFVFEKPDGGWVDMNETAKLTASDAVEGDHFGGKCSLDGNTAVVGAIQANSRAGKAYVFERSGGTWTERAILEATDLAPNDVFGHGVGISGDTAVVASRRASYMFQRGAGGWSQQRTFTGCDSLPHDGFGPIAVSGDIIAVGASLDDDDGDSSGSAYLFSITTETDTDTDGVPDGCDLCLGFDDHIDSDGDGVPDGCDACPGFDDNLDDDDDDMPNACDACSGFDDNLDADGDGMPDGCDECPNDPDNDSDGDGICGDVDICPALANDSETDADGDGIGDEVDTNPCSLSNVFSDFALGGEIAGVLLDGPPVNFGFTIRDADAPQGVQVIRDGSWPHAVTLQFSCFGILVDQNGQPAQTLLQYRVQQSPNSSVIYTCGSLTIEVEEGSASVEFTIDDVEHELVIEGGGTVTLENTVDELEEPLAVTVTTDPEASPGTVTVDGQEATPGQTANVLSVEIDIKPGTFPNTINLGSHGSVPVAILSRPGFNATLIDPLTVRLSGAEVNVRGNGTPQASEEDVNGDGLMDLVVHVSTEALSLSEEDIEASLSASASNGETDTIIRGIDTIRVVP